MHRCIYINICTVYVTDSKERQTTPGVEKRKVASSFPPSVPTLLGIDVGHCPFKKCVVHYCTFTTYYLRTNHLNPS